MNRTLHILGLCSVAMLALSAAGASTTMAATEFHSEIPNPVLTGAQTKSFGDKLVVDAGTVECENITYTGSLPGGGTTGGAIKLEPTFTGCTSTFGSPVTIDANECEYVFHSEGAKVDILCPGATKAISITALGCVVTVPEQSGLSGLTYTNAGAGSTRDITIEPVLTELKYEEHIQGISPTCAASTLNKTNGTYTGKVTVTAENGSKEQKGLWIEGSEFHSEVSNPVLTGAQIESFGDKLTIDAGNVECETIAYTGKLSGGGTTGKEIKLKPTFTKCTSALALNVTVDTNECEYVFHSESEEADLQCPGVTKAIFITSPGCVVTVLEQSGLSGLTYTNTGSGASREIAIDPALTEIEYVEHNKGFFPNCKNNTVVKTNGVSTNKATVTAETDPNEQKGLWIEGSEFHSEVSSPALTGLQTKSFGDKLVIDAGTVECENITYTGSLPGGTTAAQLNLAPAFTGTCFKGFGNLITIDTNECEYVFHSESKKADILCPGATKAIFITVFGCTVTVPEQSGLSGLTYTNAGAGSSRHLTIDFALSGINYEEHNKGFFPTCKSNTVSTSNGTYTGEATVTAEIGALEQKGLWVE